MIVIYDSSHRAHNPSFEVYDGIKTKYPELPDRIETIERRLRLSQNYEFVPPHPYSDDLLFVLHKSPYVSYVELQSSAARQNSDTYPSNFIHDTYAPLVRGTYSAARQSLSIALTGADFLLRGEDATYALCRPPGHHAGDGYMGGYCYFNNAALAANRLSDNGRVSIMDIDFHHGNGTQQLFYERSDVQYVSVHANPEHNYPYTNGFEDEIGMGAGIGFNRNFLVEKNCGYKKYLEAFRTAIMTVDEFTPDYLVVSLGFDGYKDDPIAGFGLSVENYREIARIISSIRVPTLFIQEGGYCVDFLGELAVEFMDSFLHSCMDD